MRLHIAAALALTFLSPTTPASASRSPYPPNASPKLESTIRATWPAHLHRAALNVAWCESRGNARAVNTATGRYHGLFQLGRREWQKYRPHRPDYPSIYSPIANSAAAYALYQDRGWQPWECRP